MCLVGAQGEGAAAALSGEEELAVAAVAALGAAAAVSESGGGAAARGRWHIPPRPFVLWLAHPVPCPTDSCRSLGSRASSSPPKTHTRTASGAEPERTFFISVFTRDAARSSRGRGGSRRRASGLARSRITHTRRTRDTAGHTWQGTSIFFYGTVAEKHVNTRVPTRDAKVKRTLWVIHPVEPDLRIKLIGRRRARVEATGASGLRQP